jgi:hypothetical protein
MGRIARRWNCRAAGRRHSGCTNKRRWCIRGLLGHGFLTERGHLLQQADLRWRLSQPVRQRAGQRHGKCRDTSLFLDFGLARRARRWWLGCLSLIHRLLLLKCDLLYGAVPVGRIACDQ